MWIHTWVRRCKLEHTNYRVSLGELFRQKCTGFLDLQILSGFQCFATNYACKFPNQYTSILEYNGSQCIPLCKRDTSPLAANNFCDWNSSCRYHLHFGRIIVQQQSKKDERRTAERKLIKLRMSNDLCCIIVFCLWYITISAQSFFSHTYEAFHLILLSQCLSLVFAFCFNLKSKFMYNMLLSILFTFSFN